MRKGRSSYSKVLGHFRSCTLGATLNTLRDTRLKTGGSKIRWGECFKPLDVIFQDFRTSSSLACATRTACDPPEVAVGPNPGTLVDPENADSPDFRSTIKQMVDRVFVV